MAVKILIKRKVVDKNIVELLILLKRLRQKTIEQPGYIYGETLRCVDNPEECLVISTWYSLEDWESWLNNEERISIQSEIDLLLGEVTEYTVYEV